MRMAVPRRRSAFPATWPRSQATADAGLLSLVGGPRGKACPECRTFFRCVPTIRVVSRVRSVTFGHRFFATRFGARYTQRPQFGGGHHDDAARRRTAVAPPACHLHARKRKHSAGPAPRPRTKTDPKDLPLSGSGSHLQNYKEFSAEHPWISTSPVLVTANFEMTGQHSNAARSSSAKSGTGKFARPLDGRTGYRDIRPPTALLR